MSVNQTRDDVTIDVSSGPYERGFKFNTLPFGGMTIDAGNAVRIGSASDIKLVPPSGYTVKIGTTGSLPQPTTPSSDLRGAIFLVRGDTGVADTLQICLKTSTDDYTWVVLATG